MAFSDSLHLFSVDELERALRFITRDETASRFIAEEMTSAMGRSVLAPDDFLYTLLALVSDACAERVGRVRGQTREEVLAWRATFLAENGDPSTWEITREDDG